MVDCEKDKDGADCGKLEGDKLQTILDEECEDGEADDPPASTNAEADPPPSPTGSSSLVDLALACD